MKNDYLDYIRQAGFDRVDVIGEAPFPIDDMAHDITAKAVKANPGTIKEMSNAVLSIKVSALKR